MVIPDPDSPASKGPLKAARLSCGRFRLVFPATLILTCAVLGATQCYAQNVAEAARQERARKGKLQKKSAHVYTNEDLKHDKILTPEDRAQIEAKKNQPATPATPQPQQTFDARSLPPNAPLGDVARHFREKKQLKKLQESAQFHLPVADTPALASPKPPVQPLRPPTSKPAAPPFARNRPPVKRSPFERPRAFVLPPTSMLAPHPPAARVTPMQPAKPLLPGPAAAVKLDAVTVKRGDSLWKLAQQNLGRGLRWHEILTVNPGIRDPNHIRAGSQIFLPAASATVRATAKFTVRKGDSLWKIARAQLGHGSFWTCIGRANPNLSDANLIHEGQVLTLPTACTP